MMGNEGISVADALALRGNGGYNGGSGFGGWGGDGAWWIIILILLFGAGGWNRGGFGGNGGGGACCTPATAQGLADAFNFNQLDNSLRGLERGLCDGFYNNAQQVNSVLAALQNCCCDTKMAMMTGFNGVNQGICNLGYNV